MMDSKVNFRGRRPPLSAMGQVVESIGLADDIEGKCRICSGRISEKYMTRKQANDFRLMSEFFMKAALDVVFAVFNYWKSVTKKEGNFFVALITSNDAFLLDTVSFRDYSPYRCSGCKCGISPNDKVYKLKTGMVFHENCHFCSRCGIPLSSGEPILVDEVGQTMTCMRHFYSGLLLSFIIRIVMEAAK
ncbi:LIM domain protein [Dictyocaulus viviparus]|uniref:LIM domain protein n=1 Tax=Dictyocaulus viviparus TaxID=29172 RepID=A0A0D8XDA2_DICVI|nr:LIM domain protein [Dictyocaulus viviparus]